MTWPQIYDPLHNPVFSTLMAALPVVVLLGALGLLKIRAHYSALLGLATALIVSVMVYSMPARMAASTAIFGAAYGLFPIGWIILNVIFLYQLTKEKGLFDILRESITNLTQDRRLQLLLVAFSFGAFFEGAAGFGTPVAVTGAILIGLGFTPLEASALSLIANTAPVAYGALGAPIIGLQVVPFWLIWAFVGFRATLEIWPAVLVAGLFFAIPQFLISNFHGPWLVDVVSAIISMGAVAVLLKCWRPKRIWRFPGEADARESTEALPLHSSSEVRRAWTPWIILSVIVFLWGLPQVKAFLDGYTIIKINVPGLHNLVQRMPPVVAKPTAEGAIFNFNWLTATGSGILIASIVAGIVMGYSLSGLVRAYWNTLKVVRFSLLTIAAMMAIGFVTRYAGLDATMGLAFANSGFLYPFFGTLLGWLGVALTGSDTSSNVLFGSLQKITATQLGLSPTLMAAANSSGGVMGKMIDAQSIVVASTATRWYGHEGDILRYVFFHSLALASLVGILVFLQAYVLQFMVVR
jgi:lactate permease